MPGATKHTKTRRFPILVSPFWRALLFPFGVTPERAFAAIDDGELRVSFGRLFDHRFPREAVETVAPSGWPLWAGIGLRTDFRRTVGLVGAYVNTVEVRFKERQRVRMVVPLPCERLGPSLGGPGGVLAAPGKGGAAPGAAAGGGPG